MKRIKYLVLLQAIYRVNAVSIKIPMAIFAEIENAILQFVWKQKRA